MALEKPSRRIVVEPIETPQPTEAPVEAPEPVEVPEREKEPVPG